MYSDITTLGTYISASKYPERHNASFESYAINALKENNSPIEDQAMNYYAEQLHNALPVTDQFNGDSHYNGRLTFVAPPGHTAGSTNNALWKVLMRFCATYGNDYQAISVYFPTRTGDTIHKRGSDAGERLSSEDYDTLAEGNFINLVGSSSNKQWNNEIIVIDDVASTGQTLSETTRWLVDTFDFDAKRIRKMALAGSEDYDRDNNAPEVFNRIHSLMGVKMHLYSERSGNLPAWTDGDTTASFTNKLIAYNKRNHAPFSDEEIIDALKVREPEIISAERVSGDDWAKMWFSHLKHDNYNAVYCFKAKTEYGEQFYIVDGLDSISKLGEYAARAPWTTPLVVNFKNATDLMTVANIKRDFIQYLKDNPEVGQHFFIDKENPQSDLTPQAQDAIGDIVDPLFNKRNRSSRYGGWFRPIDPNEISPLEDRIATAVAGNQMVRVNYRKAHGYEFNQEMVDKWDWELEEKKEKITRSFNDSYRKFLQKQALQDFIIQQVDDERDVQATIQHVRRIQEEHSATVYQEKKNIPQIYLDAANKSVFKQSGDYQHVEIDSDVDLERFHEIEKDYQKISKSFPKTNSTPTLRFRKTGRHHALGVYHPVFDNVAVDPRFPTSFFHERGHHLDFTLGDSGMLSLSKDYARILKTYKSEINIPSGLKGKTGYYNDPTEVFARSFEYYHYLKGTQSSFLKEPNEYETRWDYTAFEPVKEDILNYFDTVAPQQITPVVAQAREIIREPVEVQVNPAEPIVINRSEYVDYLSTKPGDFNLFDALDETINKADRQGLLLDPVEDSPFAPALTGEAAPTATLEDNLLTIEIPEKEESYLTI
jgi:hypothetical protein